MQKFTRLQDETPMPWGKHKGKEICDVPPSYLFWLEGSILGKAQSRRSSFENGLLFYIEENRGAMNFQMTKKSY